MVKEFVKGKRYKSISGKIFTFVFMDEYNDPMFEMHPGFLESKRHKGYFSFTLEDAKMILTELPDEVCEKVIKVYINASMSQLSIARHSGGAIVNGKKYIWDYANDSLVLKSYKKEWAKIAEKKPLWR